MTDDCFQLPLPALLRSLFPIVFFCLFLAHYFALSHCSVAIAAAQSLANSALVLVCLEWALMFLSHPLLCSTGTQCSCLTCCRAMGDGCPFLSYFSLDSTLLHVEKCTSYITLWGERWANWTGPALGIRINNMFDSSKNGTSESGHCAREDWNLGNKETSFI